MLNREIYHECTQKFSPGPIPGLRGIGIECEIPVVSKNGEAVTFAVMQSMFRYLAEHGFDLEKDEAYNVITAAVRTNLKSEEEFGFTQDTITVDSGFCTLEIALAPQRNLFAVRAALDEMLELLVPWFEEQNCKLLGYGVQPVEPPARNLLTPGERYLFAEQTSSNRLIPKSQGADSDLLNISASNQCHIEVSREEAVTAVNLLNAFSGLSIALHANSPIWKGSLNGDFKANREMFWDQCFPDMDLRTGVPPQFENWEAYLQYILALPPILVKRNESYFRVDSQESFTDYLNQTDPVKVKTLFGGDRLLNPQLSDIHQHFSFFWFNARLVPRHGTVESRMCCQQPPNETLCTSALTLGILENQQEAEKLMNRYAWAAWKQLRDEASEHTFAAQIEGKSILPLLEELLEIASQGLRQRNLGEEIFLTPLYKRLKRRKAPADDMIDLFLDQGINGLLEAAAFKVSTPAKLIQLEELMFSLP